MKISKIAAGIVLAGLAWAGVARGENLSIFLETYADYYADGSSVVDGEYYALVWLKTGVTFAGFKADGTLVNSPEDAHLFTVQPWAMGGCVAEKQVQINEALAKDYLDKGTWNFFVLDTRVASGTDADGKPVYVSGQPTAVNGWGLVASFEVSRAYGELIGECYLTDDNIVVRMKVGDIAVVPESVGDTPRISAIRREGGSVYLKVADTASCLQYDVSSGSSPMTADSERYVARQPKVGDPDKAIELEVPVKADDKNKFYRIIRHIPSERATVK